MSCLEDPDISIRLQALELAARMISSDTLQQMVNRLTGQLIDARQIKGGHTDVRKSMHSGWEDTGLQEQESHSVSFALPADYIVEVLHRILDMCSHNNYSDLPDFVWYVEILGQLVTLIPPASEGPFSEFMTHQDVTSVTRKNIALRIGSEIRNVAVRVMDVRREATIAAESLLLTDKRQSLFFVLSDAVDGILGPLAWVVVIGRYVKYIIASKDSFSIHTSYS
ncbi:hypothetical protein EYZ11_001813 [Aspergillus tanneri]|uniref:Uncharacterized protein n=1 Tax=Aspergillus tanneri TaxID=1220188 RepID=A0A4S3JS89_9EURO|nr:hypothetical protein EYZ11_001813 [Aspergillus tanneri]